MYGPIYTKEQELTRSAEVVLEILEREGCTARGAFFVLAFAHDQGRPLPELVTALERVAFPQHFKED